ncbi:hypothetical protein [Streptomyces sp. NPDC060187]|uniref:hypothetical protein n=1 Tax=Streptomyces sp. NPDC060187 TaxID=3347067 RepID=UPI003659C7CB
MTITVIVVLLVGGLASYAVYKNEKAGAALLVGVAVIGVLYLLLGPVPGTTEQGPKPVPAPTAPGTVSPSPEASHAATPPAAS